MSWREASAATWLYARRWRLLLATVVLPVLYPLSVRYLLSMPGLISAEADWQLLKLNFFFFCWPWAAFLFGMLFEPNRGWLRAHTPPSVASKILRPPALALLVFIALSPLVPVLLVK